MSDESSSRTLQCGRCAGTGQLKSGEECSNCGGSGEHTVVPSGPEKSPERIQEIVENAVGYSTAPRWMTVLFGVILFGWLLMMLLASVGWSP